MVESNQPSGQTAYKPSAEEQKLIIESLGEGALVDEFFKANVTLSKEQAETRERLISEIEYDYQLALRKGDYYIGSAVINFYLKEAPNTEELFINSQAMAMNEVHINEVRFINKEIF